MITHILWDMDDTLLDFKKSEAYAIHKVLEDNDIAPTEETVALYEKFNQACWKALEKGEITREKLYTERFRLLFEALGLERDCSAISAEYPVRLGESAEFIPGAWELCVALKKQYKEYIVTNGNAYTSGNRIRISGLGELMDGYFISEVMGVNKPAAEYFERCMAEMPGAKRENTVIVGDSLSSDMKGGRNAGIKCVWYNPHGKLAPEEDLFDAEIRDLQELPALLEKL